MVTPTAAPAPTPVDRPLTVDAASRSHEEDVARQAALAWVVMVGIALLVATRTVATWPEAKLGAAPFFGDWGVELAQGWPSLIPAAGIAGLAVVHAPRLAEQLPWRRVVVLSGAATVAWCVALAATAGWSQVAAPLDGNLDYLAVVDRIDSPLTFLRTYTEQLPNYPLHVTGHPPGMPLVLWALDSVGLAGAGWAAALVLAGAGIATASVLVTLRDVAGEAAARRAAPFVALAPAALWLGTSADALFAGVAAAGCALVITGRRPLHQFLGGLVLGLAAFLSYGLVLVALVPVTVAVWRRDLRPLAWAGVGAAAVLVAFDAAGFWWFEGLEATRGFYWDGVAAERPGPVFALLVNPAALALATGPAVAAGFTLMRRRGLPARGTTVLAGAALAVVTVANLSGLSKGEVERIWLPFTVWLLAAAALLPRRQVHGWLAAQLGLAVVLETALRGSW